MQGVWHNIVIAGKAIENLQVQFNNSFIKKIGDGGSTSFWHEHWLGENKLSTLFPRLFRLEQSSNVSIKDRLTEDGMVWQCRRTSTGRAAGDLVELNRLLSECNFDRSCKDAWRWSISTDGVFKVKILASKIDQQILPSISPQQSTLRNTLVPKKVEIFVWRALLRRLPVRFELDRRDSIDL
ncbi:uncharacterized protein [Rutidosis leptorrhynchoides]|uniref:uncharacterized protein n=1 Tax=Rutidosis leptorrhynchoides TaxID=125765 RepID=UPI003A996200